MQYTNTLNNHPKNKRKKNYYHKDVKPLPLVVQSHITNNSNDWFLTEIQKMNNAFNHYQYNEHLFGNMNRYTFQYNVQTTVDILHHHLNDESNPNFFIKNNSTIDITEFENAFKQNKQIETIKKQTLSHLFQNQDRNNKNYIKLLNNYHLLDFEIIEEAINNQFVIPLEHLKTHLTYDAKTKNQTNKNLSDYFEFLQSIIKNNPNQNQSQTYDQTDPIKIILFQTNPYNEILSLSPSQIEAVNTLLFQKYNLSLIAEIINQILNPNADKKINLNSEDTTEILSKLLKQQYKISELSELLKFKNNTNLTQRGKNNLIKNAIKSNPELLILKNNHQINIDVNELLKNKTFNSIKLSTLLHILTVDHQLSQKAYKHLTNTQYKNLKQLMQQLKNKDENGVFISHFTNLYETSINDYHTLYHDFDEIITDKFETFSFKKLEFIQSINDAKRLLNDTLYEYEAELGHISNNDIMDDDELYDILTNYDSKFSSILHNVKTIIKQPYRFYKTYNRQLSNELKVLTIEERLKIDQYLPTKKLKPLLNTIQQHKNESYNTKSTITKIDQNAFSNGIMFKNVYAQKQFIKYFNDHHHYRTQQITGIHNESNNLKNYPFKQIIQQSINPHQQFYLNAGAKLNEEYSKNGKIFQYRQLLKEAALKNKQQYAKQIIETFKQINHCIEVNNNETNDNHSNRKYLRNKQELLQSISKNASNNTIVEQLKQTYQQNVLNKKENNLNANDETIKYLDLYHLPGNKEVLNELLNRYPKTFKLVEPTVDHTKSIK